MRCAGAADPSIHVAHPSDSAWPRRRAHIRACSYICPAWHAAGVFVSARHRFPVQIWLGRAHAIGVCVMARHRDDAAFRCIRRLGYHLQGVAETLPALHTQMNSTGSMHATAITGNGRWDSGCSVWGRSRRCGCDCLRNFFVRPPRVGLGDLPQSTDCRKRRGLLFRVNGVGNGRAQRLRIRSS